MIQIENVMDLSGKVTSHAIKSSFSQKIDGEGLTLLPALIDCHVHVRVPGQEYKEDWKSAAKAAIQGGYTTLFDMPNTLPSTVSFERLKMKKTLIEQQLLEANIPLRYQLYLGADKHHFDEIEKVKKEVIGIKVFMGSSTGDLLIDDENSLHTLFSLASEHDLTLAVHAEDEKLLQERIRLFNHEQDPRIHSTIRNPTVAARAVNRAIELAKRYRTRLYLVHISSYEELQLVRQAKKEGIEVYAEATPPHLFMTDDAYSLLGTKAVINPPLRSEQDRLALWDAIHDGTIDTIASDHAPHTLEEKSQPYGKAPAGVPGIETTLPLLLNAYSQGLLSLQKIVELTRTNIEKIFRLFPNEDVILVDLQKEKILSEKTLNTKCGWSPFQGITLKGWPIYTICQGKVYALS